MTLTEGLLAVVLAAAPAKKVTGSLDCPRRGHQILLDRAIGGGVFEICTARGVVTRVEFPEEVRSVTLCDDCAGPSGAKDALFVVRGSVGKRSLSAWPTSSRRWARAGGNVLGPVEVELEHGKAELVLKLVEPEKADRRLVFVGRDHAAHDAYLRAEKRKLETDVMQQVQERVKRELEERYKRPHRCERDRGRARHANIVVEVREICSFEQRLTDGSLGHQVVIVVAVENRANPPVEAPKLIVNKGSGNDEVSLGGPIEFEEVRMGVLVVNVEKNTDPRGPYEITLQEDGGRSRVVTVSKIEI